MKLKDLFEDEAVRKLLPASMIRIIEASGGVKIDGITNDSRKVKSGYLFVAIKGLEHDGHDYIYKAIETGAVAVLYSNKSKVKNQRSKTRVKDKKLRWIYVENTRQILGLLWASWYGFPSKKLKVIGVTGTDGKTTTTNLIYHLLKTSGERVGMVSTISARIEQREIDTGFHVTNPEPELLQKLLKGMADEGIRYAILEVTSHGLDQERTSGVDFYGAVITNVTREHLDYHKTYKAYLKTKGRLFRGAKFSVLNYDDRSYSYFRKAAAGKVSTYGLAEMADISAGDVQLTKEGSVFRLITKSSTIEIKLKLPGFYNISNALAAVSVCLELGLDLNQIKAGLESFSNLEGRFDEINLGQLFRVIIDFAHTPNALAQVLGLSLKIKNQKSKLIVVFGCAGERDRNKRPRMGEIAGKLANLIVLTAEDPRRENVNDIIDQIAEGCRKAGAVEIRRIKNQELRIKGGERCFVKIPDRREAIEFAIAYAGDGDIILVSGKGHEKSMCFGTVEYPWDDKRTAVEVLKRKIGT